MDNLRVRALIFAAVIACSNCSSKTVSDLSYEPIDIGSFDRTQSLHDWFYFNHEELEEDTLYHMYSIGIWYKSEGQETYTVADLERWQNDGEDGEPTVFKYDGVYFKCFFEKKGNSNEWNLSFKTPYIIGFGLGGENEFWLDSVFFPEYNETIQFGPEFEEVYFLNQENLASRMMMAERLEVSFTGTTETLKVEDLSKFRNMVSKSPELCQPKPK